MNLKSSIVSGLFAATVLVGGLATTNTAFAQSNQTCVRAPISQAQRSLTHAKSANAMTNRCVVTGNQASIRVQAPTASLASDGTSHSQNNPNNVR